MREQNMRGSLRILGVGLLSLALVAGAFEAFAQKSSAKKSSKSSKAKTKAKAAQAAAILADERAASNPRVAVPSGNTNAGTTTTTTTVVDEATEIEMLRSNLMMCLVPKCEGDVPYETCFPKGQVEYVVKTDTLCKGYYDAASSDRVRLTALTQATAKVNEYFQESCKEAGGTVRGGKCEISICYWARGEESGSDLDPRCQGYTVGKTVSCNSTAFGLTAQDMQYKPEKMSVENLTGVISGGMQVLTGGVNTVMNIAQASSASKKLRQMERVDGDAVYLFNGTSLQEKAWCKQYRYESKGMFSGCSEVKCPDGFSPDGEGDNEECRCKKEISSAVDCGWGEKPDVECANSSEVKGSFNNQKGCWVKITNTSAAKRDKKTQELIRTLKDLESLRTQAERATQFSNIITYGQQASMMKEMSNVFGTSTTTSSTAGKHKCESETKTCPPDRVYGCRKEDIEGFARYNGCEELVPNRSFVCLKRDQSAGYINCTWDARDKNFYGDAPEVSCIAGRQYIDSNGETKKVPDDINAENYGIAIAACEEYMKKNVNPFSSDNIFENETRLRSIYNMGAAPGKKSGFQQELDGTVSDYNSTLSAYKSTQSEINRREAERKELEAKKAEGVAGAWASGSTEILGGGMAITTSLLAADADRKARTGSCYVGDPKAGGRPFTSDGSMKKVGWSN
ncbi:MAG: hypothetical protein LBO78_03045 [Rickettsiales bacterium]|jgi:hypothetical protein|nr:hypothetical protein [Rickettsiales bacterium]